jgi:hypothetical protein
MAVQTWTMKPIEMSLSFMLHPTTVVAPDVQNLASIGRCTAILASCAVIRSFSHLNQRLREDMARLGLT